MPMLIHRSMDQFSPIALFDGLSIDRISDSLKRCPLCDSINAIDNAECVTCRWAGVFDVSSEGIRQGLLELVDQCPELSTLMRPSRRNGLLARVRQLWRRKLDLRV